MLDLDFDGRLGGVGIEVAADFVFPDWRPFVAPQMNFRCRLRPCACACFLRFSAARFGYRDAELVG